MLARLPTSFPHGTRASYTHGCRCDACKASNRAYYHDRRSGARARRSPSYRRRRRGRCGS